MTNILAIDVGTTAFKIGVFTPHLEKLYTASRRYEVNYYDQGKADIEPEKWWQALQDCCQEMRPWLSSVSVIALSVTTPALTPIAADGSALGPAILFLDGRSHKQAREIRALVGEGKFLRETCNLPVSGGSSLASILWIRENQPDVWKRTAKFGHCNTYMVRRLTGEWAIDPSTVSITGLYNTAHNDLTWNQDVLSAAEIPQDKLPPLMPSQVSAGKILPHIADSLGLPRHCQVLCGANDAVLACLSSGLVQPGDINDINGTCDITAVCVDHPISSPNFNIRCHVIPNRWLTFFVLNTGGRALEWFHDVYCSEMTNQEFFGHYLPSVIEDFFNNPDIEQIESKIPLYVPYLQGSRYTTEPLTASFSGLTLETNRDRFLLALLRGNAAYHGEHLRELAGMINLNRRVMMTGGGAQIRGIERVKRRWTGDFEYYFQEQSSLLGAAMLGKAFIDKEYVR